MLSKNGQSRRLLGRAQRGAVTALLLLVTPALVNVAGVQDASADPGHVSLPEAQTNKRVKLTKAKPAGAPAKRKPYARFDPSGHATLPGAGSATVAVGKRVRAGTSPISVSAPARGIAPPKVTVTTVDQETAQAAGVHGVMFTLRGSGSAGAVGVDVDSGSFRNAFGGDYAARLHLVRLPGCSLTTPAEPRCQVETPISAALSAQVTVAATDAVVLAADSADSGPTGDYTATALSPGGTWSVSGNTGAFTYSYPIAVPPAIGGASPSVELGYDSSTQDARTEGTNNQSSWLGDGWSSTENYIERTYKACSDVSGSGAPSTTATSAGTARSSRSRSMGAPRRSSTTTPATRSGRSATAPPRRSRT